MRRSRRVLQLLSFGSAAWATFVLALATAGVFRIAEGLHESNEVAVFLTGAVLWVAVVGTLGLASFMLVIAFAGLRISRRTTPWVTHEVVVLVLNAMTVSSALKALLTKAALLL